MKLPIRCLLLVTPQVNTQGAFWSFADMHSVANNLIFLTSMFPAEVEQGDAFLFELSHCKKCRFCSLFNATLKTFHIFVLFVGG